MSPAFFSHARHNKGLKALLVSTALLSLVLAGTKLISQAYAQEVPGSADVGRIQHDRERDLPLAPPATGADLPAAAAPAQMPEGARDIHLVLNDVIIEDSTSFSADRLQAIYTPYLNRDITLDQVYAIAARITELYRSEGFFLSLAYVPEQKIGNGVVRIKVIEGYIGLAEIDPAISSHAIVRYQTDKLMSKKPLRAKEMESYLLRMNDLPGYAFRAVLSPLPDHPQGAIKLTLVPEKEKGQALVSIDNFSSRFLGPHQLSASYQASFLPLQQTGISVLAGLPTDRLTYLTIDHAAAIAPDLTLQLSANVTRSEPGYSLEPLEIESSSNYLSAGIEWQYLRQRSENLSFSATLDRRNTDIDFLDTPFTRDRVRTLRLGAKYDGKDRWDGYNWITATLTRGLPLLGASSAGDDNLSREDAKPDFTKAEITLTHWHQLSDDFSLVLSAAGQLASGALYSSEEFGYGGQSFGRAYDSSEITGDHGASAAAEFQYNGIDMGADLTLTPYLFYDIGVVWNEDEGQPKRESGASAGLGARLETSGGLSFNGGLALPLTRSIEPPVYGGSDNGPRIFLQLSHRF